MREIYISVVLILLITTGHSQYAENDWEDRDSWMNLEDIYNYGSIKEGSYVADIGCHEGYMSFHLSQIVGEQGKIYAVDVRDDRLVTLDEIAGKRGVKNIETILGDYDNPNLPEGSLDVVIIIDAYHEIKDYKEVLMHIKKSLKPNGKLLILEKLKSKIIGKTRAEQTAAHSLSAAYVEEELAEAGFVDMESYENLGYWENNKEKEIWIIVGKLPSS